MKFVIFKTPKAKQFKYSPRFYDPDKEALEQKKAAMGYESTVSHRENLRMQMHRRWHRKNRDESRDKGSLIMSYTIYAVVIVGGVYLLFFTDFVEKLIAVFGISK